MTWSFVLTSWPSYRNHWQNKSFKHCQICSVATEVILQTKKKVCNRIICCNFVTHCKRKARKIKFLLWPQKWFFRQFCKNVTWLFCLHFVTHRQKKSLERCQFLLYNYRNGVSVIILHDIWDRDYLLELRCSQLWKSSFWTTCYVDI